MGNTFTSAVTLHWSPQRMPGRCCLLCQWRSLTWSDSFLAWCLLWLGSSHTWTRCYHLCKTCSQTGRRPVQLSCAPLLAWCRWWWCQHDWEERDTANAEHILKATETAPRLESGQSKQQGPIILFQLDDGFGFRECPNSGNTLYFKALSSWGS